MNTEITETKTVYIGKGRYGTNHKGHGIATYAPAPRPNPGQGSYVYTVTITDVDGTETVLPEPIEAIHAEAVAVKVWEERNPAAVPVEEPAPAVELGTRVEIIGGPDTHRGATGTVTNRYSIRHGHKMNDVTTDWGNVVNYYADSQLKVLEPAPKGNPAHAARIARHIV